MPAVKSTFFSIIYHFLNNNNNFIYAKIHVWNNNDDVYNMPNAHMYIIFVI